MLEAIAEYGPSPMVQGKLADLERGGAGWRGARRAGGPRRPGAAAARLGRRAARLFEAKFRGLARDSPEFGDLLRQVVPEFHVYLVRLCDGGHLHPRARVRLDLAGLVADARHVPGFADALAPDADAGPVRAAAAGADPRRGGPAVGGRLRPAPDRTPAGRDPAGGDQRPGAWTA